MYIPWSNDSLRRAVQITENLSAVYERLQARTHVAPQEMLQAKQELDELRARAEVPGVVQMHQKYNTLLHPYLQSGGLGSRTSQFGD